MSEKHTPGDIFVRYFPNKKKGQDEFNIVMLSEDGKYITLYGSATKILKFASIRVTEADTIVAKYIRIGNICSLGELALKEGVFE